ncbi:MAG TPA: tetratricopeptide repeat protein [Chloroflexia bacterium]|nr:tetratricopeptide repeat protein [Chloroflexia bacterium]
MQTVSPPPGTTSSNSTDTTKSVRSKRNSYAPVLLAVLVVVAFFIALSFVIATDDVARVVSAFGMIGWGVAAVGLVLGLIALVRNQREVLGLGIKSGMVLVILGLAVSISAPFFIGPAHSSQARQAFNTQNYERAIEEYRQAGNSDFLHDQIPQAYLSWGDQLTKAGDFEKALAVYTQANGAEYKPNPYEQQLLDARAHAYMAWAARLDKENTRNWTTLTDQQKSDLDNQLLEKYDAAIALQPSTALVDQAKSGARNVLYREAEDLKAQNNYQELDTLYQKVVARYLDGKQQSTSEVEVRLASNYLDWAGRLSSDSDYNGAIDLLNRAETRFARYDPRKVDSILPDMLSNYSKLAPQLVADGKAQEAVQRLEEAYRTYGSKDNRNVLAQALLNSYDEYGKVLENRSQYTDARDQYKLALDLNNKFKFNDSKPRDGLSRSYLALGIAAEQKSDFQGAINIYREGLKNQYFNQADTNTVNGNISRAYFGWAQQADQANDFDKTLSIYRDGLNSNGFDAASKGRAIDAGGDLFVKQATAAETRQDLKGAVDLYLGLVNDPLFKNSAAARNLVNLAPKTIFTLSDQYLKDAQQPDGTLNPQKVGDARNLLQSIVTNFGGSDYANRAKDMLNAQVNVTGKILNNKGEPLGNRAVQFSSEWKFCANTPDNDPDCKGSKDGFVAKGDVVGITTAPDGGWVVKLNPNKTYLVSWQERGGKWTSAFTGTTPQPAVLIKVNALEPIKYEYRTPTEAPQ